MKKQFWRTLVQKRVWRSNIFAFLLALVAASVVIPLLLPHAAKANVPGNAQVPGNVQFVEPAWVADHASDPNLRILDVRLNPLDYIAEHIPNAVHVADNTFRGPNGVLPVQYWQTDKLQSIFTQAGVTDNSNVLVYSDGRDVLGATMVAYLLERSGHGNIAVLDGGLAGYKAAGLKTAKEFPAYRPGTFTVQDDASIRVTLDQVKELIGKPGVVFIDPRPPELFAGEQNIWVRNGHIPGARNIPWVTFTVGEANFHKLKPLDQIRQILADRNITPENDIIVSCSTGREATLQYNVLKHLLGYPKVRVYEGSWTEYSSYPDLPVETGRDA
jgi:thiosulfate/3-mercaptopyruvate sulfurtransferase